MRLRVLALLAAAGCAGEVEDTPAADASPADADAVTTAADATPAPPPDAAIWPEQYPPTRTHSPITPSVVTAVGRIAAQAGPDDAVFAKVGDSITVSTAFLHCFAGANVDLGERGALAPTWQYFLGGQVGGTTPWDRTSLAARGGYAAFQILAGSPSMLEQELAAARPRFAVVMLGTNDVGYQDLLRYGDNMLDIVEQLAAAGAVPILSSIPPRDDSATADAWVPRYNAVSRGIAQAYQLPYMDYHHELLPLPSHGLASDGVHPNVYSTAAGTRPCVFTADGLQKGYNVRNLLALEALDRALAAVAGAALDEPALPVRGTGTFADPVVIPGLPFGDRRDTRTDGEARVPVWTGCSTANEGGAEVYYRLDLAAPARVRVMVFARAGADIDAHLVRAEGTAAACLARHDTTLTADLAAGTWLLALDTYVSATSGPLPGPYLLVVNAEP